MKYGEINLKGDMLVLCSMPFEMLEYSGMKPSKRKDGIKPLLGADEAFIEGLNDNTEITLCRYPHLSSGSVCSLVNKQCYEYIRWFNLMYDERSSGIVIVSPWESNIMVKLGGADFDSDTALNIKEPIIQKAARELMNKDGIMKPLCDRFAPGVDGLPVAESGDVLKGVEEKVYFTAYQYARLDNILSKTQVTIGSISNDIQLFNSYLWEALQSEDPDKEYCQLVYECILKLSVLNELEIDRAKHPVFITPSFIRKDILTTTDKKGFPILKKRSSGKTIKKIAYRDPFELKYYYQPAFLYEIKYDRGNRSMALRTGNKYWNCPPDHLSKLAAGIRKPRRTYKKKKVDFSFKDIEGKQVADQVERIENILKDTVKKLDRLDRRRYRTGEETDERIKIHRDCVDSIVGMKRIPEKNIAAVVRDTMCMKKTGDDIEYYDYYMYINKYRILGLLFMVEEGLDEEYKKKNIDLIENPVRKVFRKLRIVDA